MSTLAMDVPLARAGSRQSPSPSTAVVSLRACFLSNRRRILITYGLFAAENVVFLARPWALGVAVNDMLAGSSRGLLLFVVQQLVFTALAVVRQMYDTRFFTAMYGDLVSRLVVMQRRLHVGTSRVAARSSLSREVVDFFERSVPFLLHGLFSVGGALVMLVLVDGWLVPACLTLLLPAYLLSVKYARRSYALNGELNDSLEREVEVIRDADPDRVRAHFDGLARHRVRLSDLQAGNHGSFNILYLGLMVTAVVRAATVAPDDAGQIFALIGYVTMFAMGLFHAPVLVQQWTRLRDIQARLNHPHGNRPTARAPAEGSPDR